jgi:phosphatidylcholine synthase
MNLKDAHAPMSSDAKPLPSRGQQVAAWGVHLYTSLGLPLALASLIALIDGDATLFFLLNLSAVLIDATDGFLARTLKVKEILPLFNGAKLDDLIDFLTFTFLPVISIFQLALLPREYAPWLALPLIASAYGFCQQRAKTEDAFVGFPSYWNIAAFYLYLFTPAPLVTLGLIIFLSVMTFVPIHYIYPSRTPLLFKTTVLGGLLWACALAYLAITPESPQRFEIACVSLSYVVYYILLSFLHHYRVTRRATISEV